MVFYFKMFQQTDIFPAGSKHLFAKPLHKDFSQPLLMPPLS
jgi:hypothetical protein